MRLLRLGTTGDDVFAWEVFLKGRYPKSCIIVEGKFDQSTYDHTKKFQSECRITSDGIVGIVTIAEAMKRGYNPGLLDDRIDSGSNWPPKPTNVVQMTKLERQNLFGNFEYVPAPTKNNPEAIKIIDDWQKKNIVIINIPQLIGVKGASKSGNVQFHEKSARQLQNLFKSWEDAGLRDRILSFGGTWVARFIRGSNTTLSNHSLGTAFDINVTWNALGTQGALKGQEGSVRELVDIAVENGFLWGGWFKKRSDPMHFECYKLI